MQTCCKIALLFFGLSVFKPASGQTMRAGVGRKIITPILPFLLTGYAGRNTPATEKIHDIWAKSLLIEASDKSRMVIITTDILGLSPEIENRVTDSLQKKYRLNRSEIVLNSSHTHSGPFIWPALGMIGDYDSTTLRSFTSYGEKLGNSMIESVELAFGNLRLAKLSSGHGEAMFAKNRRQPTAKGIINGINPTGLVDHDVPVLKIESADGNIFGVLFGYACHNTTVTGSSNVINGDYAGFAQIEIEKRYPGATALFFSGCSGDQNPQPRGTLALAAEHGKELADAVDAVLKKKNTPISGAIKTKTVNIELALNPYPISGYREQLETGNVYLQRRAKLMIEALNKGWKIDTYKYPVQALRIGSNLTMIALAGEVVVDYSLAIKKLYPKENLFVAGYSNEVICYIPTKKILAEGGYEAVENMIYYGMSGPFANSVESRIMNGIKVVMSGIGVSQR